MSEIDEALKIDKKKIERSVKAQVEEETKEMRADLLAEHRKKAAAKLHKENEQIEKAESKREEKLLKKKIKEEIRYEIHKSLVINEDNLYEQVWDDENESRFCYIEDSKVKFAEDVDDIYPIDDDAIIKGVVLLPDGVEDYGDIKKLMETLQKHLHKYLDISMDMEIFAAFYILFSWVYDKSSTLNYLRTLGDWGSGKSRYLDVIGRVCYKPILVNGALTPAPVYRLLDLWRGTLIIDEADFKDSDEQAQIIKILNAGFEKSRATITRCNPNDVSKIDTFQVFGPKVIASRKSWRDQALESRCMTEKMMVTTRKDIIPVLDDDFFEAERVLRRKLLKFRFDYYNKISYKYRDLGIPDLEPRLKQAVSSFSILLYNIPELLEKFKKFIREYNDKLIEERSSSWEGMIVQALVALLMDGFENIQTKEVVDRMNEMFGTEAKAVGTSKILKSMGFDIKLKRTEAGVKRAIIFNFRTLKTVVERYLQIDHEMRKICHQSVTLVTDVTQAIGGLMKIITNKENRQGGGLGSGSPVTPLQSVTSVTKILEKVPKKAGISLDNLFLSLKLDKVLKSDQLSSLEGVLKKLLREGQIFEPNPGHFQRVG